MLGRVIRALSESDFKQGSYIAYRDSALTLLLKDSLGGNSQTAVIVTVHPNKRFIDETVLTLRFAQQVKKVKNHVSVNEDLTGESVDAFKAEIRRLNMELAEVKRRCQQMEVKAEKVAEKDHLIEQLKIEHEKEMDEKIQELNVVKVRYARCIDSFELLRRYQETPAAVFDIINEYLELGGELQEGCCLPSRNCRGSDLANQTSECEENAEEFEKERKEKERSIDVEITKAGYNALRKRLSMGSKDNLGGPISLNSAAELKKDRRMTRFAMRSSSYNRRSGCVTLQPAFVGEDGSEDPFGKMKEVDAECENEKLKLECENNRLAQINEEFDELLMRSNKEKSELLVRNDQLLKDMQRMSEIIEEKENAIIQGNEELSKVRQMCRKAQLENEKHWKQICSLNTEKECLVRKTDELKEVIEDLESNEAVLRLNLSDKEKEMTQLNEKFEMKWDTLHQELFKSVTDIANSEELMSAKEDCDVAADCVDDLVHGSGSYRSKVRYMQRLREQLASSKERVVQLEKELALLKANRGTTKPQVTKSRASRQKGQSS
uniref:Kinesin motor domain-containing protein n=1 Tax=Syphacia muris TaxID=451379 RepID=A0A0N5APT7_9BILA